MRSYPRTQRAIAAVLKDAIKAAGTNPTALARDMGQAQHFARRMVKLERDVTVAEWIAIARKLRVRPSELLDRVEARLR
jgi:hypothetical protein